MSKLVSNLFKLTRVVNDISKVASGDPDHLFNSFWLKIADPCSFDHISREQVKKNFGRWLNSDSFYQKYKRKFIDTKEGKEKNI
ncbi:hypothetical protein ES695_09950 [Candidatus Atribacteria bacterium 1244-E10-H5-B2]|nr:MAG: hypothetical protein ES695_09950 [Candidatus Atribacteria bacterium 1244-E10-H5-B2]